MRSTLIAAAMLRCCKCVFAKPSNVEVQGSITNSGQLLVTEVQESPVDTVSPGPVEVNGCFGLEELSLMTPVSIAHMSRLPHRSNGRCFLLISLLSCSPYAFKG